MPIPSGYTASEKVRRWVRQQKSGARFTHLGLHKELGQPAKPGTILSYLRDLEYSGEIVRDGKYGRMTIWKVV